MMKKYIVVGPIVIVLLWAFVSATQVVSPLILSSPWEVAKALLKMLFWDRSLLPHLGLTCYRTIISFLVACVLGIPIGLAMGFMPRVYRSLEIVVDFFRSIPPIALFPLFLLILGIGEQSKLGVSVYGCTLVIIVNSAYGVLNAPSIRRTVGTVYGLSKWQVFKKIVLPDSLSHVFVGMRTSLSLALVLTVVVEMFIGSQSGLGKKIYDYHLVFDTPEMYATIVVTGIVGYTINKNFVWIERRLLHWIDR